MAMAEVESSNVMPKLIEFLSSRLEKMAESNDLSRGFHPQKISVFHGLSRPTISIQSYLERIFKYANCSPSCFVVAYVYLDRFAQRQPSLPINSFNVHRLLITSVLVAAKFMDDVYYNNAFYAKVGGISTREMNYLEVDFLFGVGFHLNVTPNTFHTYCTHLQRETTLVNINLIHHQPGTGSGSGSGSGSSLCLPPQSSSLHFGTSSHKPHLPFNQEETSHQQHQRQHQHQLAV